MTEATDYEAQDQDKYYKRDHLEEFAEHFECVRHLKVLNVGCGRGQSLETRPSWKGCDFNYHDATYPRVMWYDARNLSQLHGKFEYTVSVDFLEHVRPEDVPVVSEELHLVAPHGIHIIHLVPTSSFKGLDGKNLHPSGHQPQEWWAEQLGATVTSLGSHVLATW